MRRLMDVNRFFAFSFCFFFDSYAIKPFIVDAECHSLVFIMRVIFDTSNVMYDVEEFVYVSEWYLRSVSTPKQNRYVIIIKR